jgi:hypothetical protein
MNGPNSPTVLRRASPGADLPEVPLLNWLGASPTMHGMVAIRGATAAVDLSSVDKRWPRRRFFNDGDPS